MNRTLLKACLLGGALGDSVGLPSEGINARRIARLRPGALSQSLVFGKGMISDDTEHAVMTLLSLMDHDGDARKFSAALACRLRWWLASVPAGIGLATARSLVKLWLGFKPANSGVFSAGNGPLMRAPVIGVWFGEDSEKRNEFVRASTLITHRDPRATEAAQMVAHAVALVTTGKWTEDEILDCLQTDIASDDLRNRFLKLRASLQAGASVEEYANSISRKPGFVSGFAPETACVAIYAWLRHRGDFRITIEAVVRAGGDTDTVGFVAGSIAGAECGPDGLVTDWLANLRDWPIHAGFIERIAAGNKARYPNWPMSLVRNMCFLLIVLTHGFRRLLPPY
ncbi:MAG: ADP-ribosylglycohydrolase family protein [Verrucomicrobiota bacterium]